MMTSPKMQSPLTVYLALRHGSTNLQHVPEIPRHTLGVVSGRMLVLAGVINREIGVWYNGLSIFVRNKYSGIMPSGAGTVIDMFPLPAWKRVKLLLPGGDWCWP